jgi:hypothetical protein
MSRQSVLSSPLPEPDFNKLVPPFLVGGVPRPLSKTELREYLGCSPKFLESEIAKGRLRQLKLSKNMSRFSWADIEAWLATKRV